MPYAHALALPKQAFLSNSYVGDQPTILSMKMELE